jgi:hypothetical protein
MVFELGVDNGTDEEAYCYNLHSCRDCGTLLKEDIHNRLLIWIPPSNQILREGSEDLDSPFKLPPVTHAPLGVQEFLKMLRSRINQGYMPSATGEQQYNSKPEYLRNLQLILDKPGQSGLSYGSGFYAQDGAYLEYTGGKKVHDIYLFLDVSNVAVLVNLLTDEAYVALSGETIGAWEPWTAQLLSVDRHLLAEKIDAYC